MLIKQLGTTTFVGRIQITGAQRIKNDFHPVHIAGQIVSEAPSEAAVTAPKGGIPNDNAVRNAAAKVNQRIKRVVKRATEPAPLSIQFHRRERVSRTQGETR